MSNMGIKKVLNDKFNILSTTYQIYVKLDYTLSKGEKCKVNLIFIDGDIATTNPNDINPVIYSGIIYDNNSDINFNEGDGVMVYEYSTNDPNFTTTNASYGYATVYVGL